MLFDFISLCCSRANEDDADDDLFDWDGTIPASQKAPRRNAAGAGARVKVERVEALSDADMPSASDDGHPIKVNVQAIGLYCKVVFLRLIVLQVTIGMGVCSVTRIPQSRGAGDVTQVGGGSENCVNVLSKMDTHQTPVRTASSAAAKHRPGPSGMPHLAERSRASVVKRLPGTGPPPSTTSPLSTRPPPCPTVIQSPSRSRGRPPSRLGPSPVAPRAPPPAPVPCSGGRGGKRWARRGGRSAKRTPFTAISFGNARPVASRGLLWAQRSRCVCAGSSRTVRIGVDRHLYRVCVDQASLECLLRIGFSTLYAHSYSAWHAPHPLPLDVFNSLHQCRAACLGTCSTAAALAAVSIRPEHRSLTTDPCFRYLTSSLRLQREQPLHSQARCWR